MKKLKSIVITVLLIVLALNAAVNMLIQPDDHKSDGFGAIFQPSSPERVRDACDR